MAALFSNHLVTMVYFLIDHFHRCVYVLVKPRPVSSSVNRGFSLVFPIIIFFFRNLMWHFSTTCSVVLRVLSFSLGLVSSRISSIHTMHVILVPVLGILTDTNGMNAIWWRAKYMLCSIGEIAGDTLMLRNFGASVMFGHFWRHWITSSF